VTTGNDIFTRAGFVLNDPAAAPRWTPAEQVLALSDGQREIATYVPQACVKTSILTLQAGTRQELIAIGAVRPVQFLAMRRNFLADGVTPGPRVSVRTWAWADAIDPNWHSATPGIPEYAFFDAAEPLAFYVSPPASGTGKGEIVFNASPADLTALSDTLTIPDTYSNALLYYVLFRALAKNSAFTKAPQAASGWYQMMLQALGVRSKMIDATDANRSQAQEMLPPA
jgi:hypothetical protein